MAETVYSAVLVSGVVNVNLVGILTLTDHERDELLGFKVADFEMGFKDIESLSVSGRARKRPKRILYSFPASNCNLQNFMSISNICKSFISKEGNILRDCRKS